MTDPQMKILVNAFPMANVNTGISRYLRCLYRSMEENFGDRVEIGYFDGKRVSSMMPSPPENLTRWDRLVSLFWRLPAYPALLVRLLFYLNQEWHFRRFAGDYDVYHEAAFFPFSVPTHVKTVFTLTDLSLLRFPEHHPRERVLFSRLFFRRRCRRVDRFLTISHFIQGEMATYLGIGGNKTTVTHLGYEPDLMYPRKGVQIRACLNRHGLPERYFLFVGSGDSRKNMRIIPEALDRAGLDIPLVVAGWKGWIDQELWDKAYFLGYVDDEDLACLYSGALALIFPSRYEGFGLPVLEAMACGCPVVTTREASMPEVAGNAAVYMRDPDDVEGLSNTLRKISENGRFRKDLKDSGLLQAERFSWRAAAEKTLSAFEEVLHKSGARAVSETKNHFTDPSAYEESRPLNVIVGSQYLNVEMGGAEKYIYEVCSRLERQHHMRLTYLSSDKGDDFGLSAAAFKVFTTGFHPGWRRQIRKKFKKIRPNVVYIHRTVPWLTDVLVQTAKELNIPVVMMYHSDVSGQDSVKKAAGFFYHRLFGRRALSSCDAFLVPSKIFSEQSNYLRQVKKPFIVASPGVEPIMSEGVRKKSGNPYLLFVGKPELKSKGLADLVAAWRSLLSLWPGLNLVVIGDKEKGRGPFKESGIRYIGYVKSRRELADWYASAAATVLPSTVPGESFGMVLAEALMAGCPVVGPRLGGVPELVQDGINGRLFESGNVQNMIETINRVLETQDMLRGNILKNRDTYVARFDWDRTAEIVAETLRSVVRANERAG